MGFIKSGVGFLRYGEGGTSSGPTNTVAPLITYSEPAILGSVLSTTNGTWNGTGTITYARQWRRNGAAISGQTGTTYTLVEADDDKLITCRVTATDDLGSRSRSSNPVGPFDLVEEEGGLPNDLQWNGDDLQWNGDDVTWTPPA